MGEISLFEGGLTQFREPTIVKMPTGDPLALFPTHVLTQVLETHVDFPKLICVFPTGSIYGKLEIKELIGPSPLLIGRKTKIGELTAIIDDQRVSERQMRIAARPTGQSEYDITNLGKNPITLESPVRRANIRAEIEVNEWIAVSTAKPVRIMIDNQLHLIDTTTKSGKLLLDGIERSMNYAIISENHEDPTKRDVGAVILFDEVFYIFNYSQSVASLLPV